MVAIGRRTSHSSNKAVKMLRLLSRLAYLENMWPPHSPDYLMYSVQQQPVHPGRAM